MERTKSQCLSKQIDKQTIEAFCEKAISVGRMVDGRDPVQTVLKRFGLKNAGSITRLTSHQSIDESRDVLGILERVDSTKKCKWLIREN